MSDEHRESVEAAVNRIRSHFLTLDRYRQTSMRAHGRHIEAVAELANGRLKIVRELAMKYPDSPEVTRWYEKFQAYIDQHQLV